MPTVYFTYVQFIVYQLYLNEAVIIIKENISICRTWQSKIIADSFPIQCVCVVNMRLVFTNATEIIW